MASTDAKPVPIKNVAYRVYFPILDADGDLVTAAATLSSSMISKDGGTFTTPLTNTITEIATSSGMYFVDLTATEMNADTVCVIIKTTTSGAKTTPIVLYPQESGDIRVAVQSVDTDGTVGVVRGTAAASSTTAIATSAMLPNTTTVANQYKGRIITFDAVSTTQAALRGQATDIVSHNSGTTPTFQVTALTTAPAAGDTFSIT